MRSTTQSNARRRRGGAVLRLAVLSLISGFSWLAPAALPFAQIRVDGRPSCTGAAVLMGGDRYFVTAAHCLKPFASDSVLTVIEGAGTTEPIELNLSDATVLLDFDVLMWPLKIWQLTKTEALTPRLTELSPGEAVTAHGYPGELAPVALDCRAVSGNLVTVDGGRLQPAHGMTCQTTLPRLGGLSGGPAIDANGRYLGVLDYQSVSGTPGRAQMGFVPYRVFKPVTMINGTPGWGALRYGYTFKDYVAHADGRLGIHVTYRAEASDRFVRASVEAIDFLTKSSPPIRVARDQLRSAPSYVALRAAVSH